MEMNRFIDKKLNTGRELTEYEKEQIRKTIKLCPHSVYELGPSGKQKEWVCRSKGEKVVCPMQGKFYLRNFCICFETEVLWRNTALWKSLRSNRPSEYKQPRRTKACVVCGNRFPVNGSKNTCSENCREANRRCVDAERKRRNRD